MKKITIAKIFLLLVSIVFTMIIMDYVYMSMSQYGEDTGVGYSRRLIIVLIILVLAYTISKLKYLRTSHFSNFFIVWTIYVAAEICLNTTIIDAGISTLLLSQVFIHFFLFFFFYIVFYEYGGDIQFFFNIMIVVWCVVLGFYLFNHIVLLNFLQIFDTSSASQAYYLLYFLPLALSINNKFWKWFSVIICAVIVLTSIKRGGFIGFTLAIFAYYLVHNFYISKSKYFVWKILVTVFVISIFIFAAVRYDIAVNDGMIIERLSEISDDGGSGRDDIWSFLIGEISESSIEKLIFGNGFFGTVNNNLLQINAHNDFLEVLYDYGIIGTFLHLWFFVLIFKKIKILIKQKSNYAAPLAACFMLLFVGSMVSAIIVYPFMSWFAIILGFIDGISNQENEIDVEIINIEWK